MAPTPTEGKSPTTAVKSPTTGGKSPTVNGEYSKSGKGMMGFAASSGKGMMGFAASSGRKGGSFISEESPGSPTTVKDFAAARKGMLGMQSGKKAPIVGSTKRFGASSRMGAAGKGAGSNREGGVSPGGSKGKAAAGVDVMALSPRSECLHFARNLVEEMQSPAASSFFPGDPLVLHHGQLRIQGYQVDCELLQYDCGPIDAEAARLAEESEEDDPEEPDHIYFHAFHMLLGAPTAQGLAPYRPILARQIPGRQDTGREDLNAENWTLGKVGTTSAVNLRFSGRPPASQDGSIREPVQSTVDAHAENPTAAYLWVDAFEQVQVLRAEYEKAALEFAEQTSGARRRAREEEQRKKEQNEEETRPDKLWKAVKAGNSKVVFDILKRPYKHTKPDVPLMALSDEASWSLLHWAANRNHKETCQVLLKNNADPFVQDAIGNTPLHLACFSNSKDVTTSLVDAMQMAKGNSAPSVANMLGSTPLMEAASNGHSDLAASLMKLKIDWLPVKVGGGTAGTKPVVKAQGSFGRRRQSQTKM